MKHCPNCDERYDEDIIRFCTKDGTPLVEDEQPSFTALPSEAQAKPDNGDAGEETVVLPKPVKGPDTTPFDAPDQHERIVIPTSFPPAEQQVRPRPTAAAYYPPPPEPNTGKTVALTIIGTLAVLTFGALLFWLLQKDSAANININTNPPNQNVNLNANLGFDGNFNFDTNSNFNTSGGINTNFNISTNVNTTSRTPSSTPTPRTAPSPSPTATEVATPRPSPRPTTTRAVPSPTTRTGPRPTAPPPPPPLRGDEDE